MDVENEILPTSKERLEEIGQPGPEGPIFMVNMLKFRDHAEYPDGRETELTGREAYHLYAKVAEELIRGIGGEVTFDGDVTFLNTGEVEELWDEIMIARYGQRSDLVDMVRTDEWKAAAVHRVAGLKGELNIETVASATSVQSV
ncbi:hypothetical protein I6E52_09890 [Salinibacterium sp. NG253]|uniref:hypothetical protein n=1 Tax=Salinibacterium sp. NG253 TaxID=2792039 RepID=UPI0018CED3BE|nr:hypothetical protein [Salinibacterium sp. NG253]MBH0117154.1 hypothetical protein [Salinibacterium sp. NG253]